jgi:hypothetical protein
MEKTAAFMINLDGTHAFILGTTRIMKEVQKKKER